MVIFENIFFWTLAIIGTGLCTLFVLYALETIREKRRRTAQIIDKQKEAVLEGNFRDEDAISKTICVSGPMSEEEKKQTDRELDFSDVLIWHLTQESIGGMMRGKRISPWNAPRSMMSANIV